MNSPSELDRLTEEIFSRSKYRSLNMEFVRLVGAQELERQNSFKVAVQATRTKLHQVSCSFQNKPIDFTTWEEKLKRISSSIDSEETSDFCKTMMKTHSSTNERLPILEQFFQVIFENLPDINSILDCACGLNPLSLPWIPVKKNISYYACDVLTDLSIFLDRYFGHYGIDGKAWTSDLTTTIPDGIFDLALILKTMPCLDQIDKNAGARLLEGIQARYLLISYPIKSLGGRDKAC